MMERYILLLFLLFSENIISAQELTIGYSYTAIVKAKSGINMRDAANATFNKILSIPYNSRITIVSYDTSYEAIIENMKGFWMNAKFNDKVGYFFSGFLDISLILLASGNLCFLFCFISCLITSSIDNIPTTSSNSFTTINK